MWQDDIDKRMAKLEKEHRRLSWLIIAANLGVLGCILNIIRLMP